MLVMVQMWVQEDLMEVQGLIDMGVQHGLEVVEVEILEVLQQVKDLVVI